MNPDVIGSGQPGELPEINTLSYEQAREELINIVSILENGQMSLDESLAYWERGEALASYCQQQLAGAREKVEAALSARTASLGEAEMETAPTDAGAGQ